MSISRAPSLRILVPVMPSNTGVRPDFDSRSGLIVLGLRQRSDRIDARPHTGGRRVPDRSRGPALVRLERVAEDRRHAGEDGR